VETAPVQIEFLGSGARSRRPGGAVRAPYASRREIPYARTGPGLFVHGPDVLIDTPEEIKDQLNRSRVREIAACFYSHWHPDHVTGRRLWEEMNTDWRR